LSPRLLFATLLAHAVGSGAIFGVVGVVVAVVAFVFGVGGICEDNSEVGAAGRERRVGTIMVG